MAQTSIWEKHMPLTPYLANASNCIRSMVGLNTIAKLPIANRFVNKSWNYVADNAAHGKPDMHQGPIATLRRGTGDCEDAAILKIALLRGSGVPIDELAIEMFFGDKQNGAAMGHAVASWKQQAILDWLDVPQPRADYYSRVAPSMYKATIRTIEVFPARVLFPVGGSFNESVFDMPSLRRAMQLYEAKKLEREMWLITSP
jgi:hypothetical protein